MRCVVVVGGGIVEDGDEGLYVRSAVHRYLLGLAACVGNVHFFGVKRRPNERTFSEELLDPPIKYTELRFAGGVAWRKPMTLLADAARLFSAARTAEAVIEFFPAGGGCLAALAACAARRPYVVYFGADPEKRFVTYRDGTLRRLIVSGYLRLSAKMVVRIAEAVLVRDGDQLQKLRRARSLRGKVAVSVPIEMPLDLNRRALMRERPVKELLFVGKLERAKGIIQLLDAFALLCSQGHALRLTIVGAATSHGSGYEQRQMREMCEERGIERHVELAGYVDDSEALSRLYERADIFVLPSWEEGFPRVLDEAMRAELPIIATNLPGIAAELKHEVSALLIAPREVEPLRQAIERLLRDEGLRRTLAKTSAELRERKRGADLDAAEQHALLCGMRFEKTPGGVR